MFERYSEKARRVVFFARYEASQFGAEYIQPEHLLLGLLREDKKLAHQFLSAHAVIEELRKQIEARFEMRERSSTSVDLPLDAEAKRVLAFAATEATTSKEIGTGHLLLGILRLENHFAAEILRERGLSIESVREKLKGDVPSATVKKAHIKPTACRDCKHLIVTESKQAYDWTNLVCGASPKAPEFDCYTGQPKELTADASPSLRFQLCITINFGECERFEPYAGADPVESA